MSDGQEIKITKSKSLIKYLDKVLKAENDKLKKNGEGTVQETGTGQHTSVVLLSGDYLLDLTTAINTARGSNFNYIVSLYTYTRSMGDVVKFIKISSDLNLDEFIRHLIIKGKFFKVHTTGYEVLKGHTQIKKELTSNPIVQLWNKEDDGYYLPLAYSIRGVAVVLIKERLSDNEQYENTGEEFDRFMGRKKVLI